VPGVVRGETEKADFVNHLEGDRGYLYHGTVPFTAVLENGRRWVTGVRPGVIPGVRGSVKLVEPCKVVCRCSRPRDHPPLSQKLHEDEPCKFTTSSGRR
jgi:hypothetical protein